MSYHTVQRYYFSTKSFLDKYQKVAILCNNIAMYIIPFTSPEATLENAGMWRLDGAQGKIVVSA